MLFDAWEKRRQRERKTAHACGGCKKLQAVQQVNEMALEDFEKHHTSSHWESFATWCTLMMVMLVMSELNIEVN